MCFRKGGFRLSSPPQKKTCSLTSHMWFLPPFRNISIVIQDASQKKQPLLSLSHFWKHILFSVPKNVSSLWWCNVIGWREQPRNIMGKSLISPRKCTWRFIRLAEFHRRHRSIMWVFPVAEWMRMGLRSQEWSMERTRKR